MIKAESNCVYWEGRKHYIVASCVTHFWYNKGVSQFFPTYMPGMDFRSDSSYPLDPNTGEPIALSPEAEKALDNESAIRSYFSKQESALAGKAKLGGLEKWLPWIAIGLAVVIGIYVYMTLTPLSKDQMTIKITLQDVLNKLNSMGIK